MNKNKLMKYLIVSVVLLGLITETTIAFATPEMKVTVQRPKVPGPGVERFDITGRGDRFQLAKATDVDDLQVTDIFIRNTGSTPLTISNVFLSNVSPAISLFVPGSLPRTLQPNRTMRTHVFLESSTVGTFSASFNIRHNAVNAPHYFITHMTGDVEINPAPRAHIDFPRHNQVISGVLNTKGWAIDNGGISLLSVQIRTPDLRRAWTIFDREYGLHRQDVCNAFPQVNDPNCPWVGWRASVDTSTLPHLPNGDYVVWVQARDNLSKKLTITRRIRIQN